MIQVLKRAMAVLEELARTPEAARSLGELAGATGLHPATTGRILRDLVELGYADQAERRKGYTLGPAAHALGRSGPYRRDLIAAADRPAAALAAATGHIVLIAALRDGERIMLRTWGEPEARHATRQVPNPYFSATGRVLTAFAPPAEQERIEQRYGRERRETCPDLATPAALQSGLAAIREQGHCCYQTGEIVGISCPVRRGQAVVAALGLYPASPVLRMGEVGDLVRRLSSAAQEISATLTPSPAP